MTWRARASGGRTQWAFSRAAVQFDQLSTIARRSQLGVVIRGAACVARARRILAPVASSRPRTERARELRKRRCEFILGTWCSGITSASHAEGPGFKSQCVRLSRMACVNCTCVPSATAHLRAFLHVVSELPHPWPRYFPVLAEAHCIKHQVSQRIRKREKRSKSCSVKVVLEYS